MILVALSDGGRLLLASLMFVDYFVGVFAETVKRFLAS